MLLRTLLTWVCGTSDSEAFYMVSANWRTATSVAGVALWLLMYFSISSRGDAAGAAPLV